LIPDQVASSPCLGERGKSLNSQRTLPTNVE
jgi:hypothetical protein